MGWHNVLISYYLHHEVNNTDENVYENLNIEIAEIYTNR